MQIAFGKKFAYDRTGLLIVACGMGLYLTAVTLNQSALARGQVRRSSLCWIACAVGFVIWTLLPVLDPFRRVEIGFAGAAAMLCGLLYLLYRRPRSPRRGRRAGLGRGARGDGWRPRDEVWSPGRRQAWRLEPFHRRARPGRDEDVAGVKLGVGPGLRLDLAVGAAQGDDQRRARDVGDPLPGTRAAGVTSISSIRYSGVDDAGDLRVQREPRHLRAARLVGRDHAVGAGALQLLLRVLRGWRGRRS